MKILLIGMPLSGKTTVGALLASRLDYYFYDSDALIRSRFGSIKEAFKDGEESFRTIENEVIEGLLQKENVVVASGGGLITTARGIDNVKKFDCVIYLYADEKELAKRYVSDGKRPLLKDVSDIKRLLEARAETYASLATFTLSTIGVSPKKVAKAAESIIQSLQ